MRNRFHLPLCALAAALTSASLHAATIVESVGGPDRVPSLLTVENGKGKQQSDPANYLLIDPGAGQFLFVTANNKQVVDMGAAPPADPAALSMKSLPTNVKLVNKGAGPKIAGYPTRHYQLFANGTLCLTTYLSSEAMALDHLKEFHESFARMQASQKKAMRAAGMRFRPCDDAQDTLTARYGELGLAMRTVGAEGSLRQEVVKIETNAKVASNLYQVPDGYVKITNEEFLRQMAGTAKGSQ